MKLAGFCGVLMLCLITARDANAGTRRLGGGYGNAYNPSDLAAFWTTDMFAQNRSTTSAKSWYIPFVDNGAHALTSLVIKVHKGNPSLRLTCTYHIVDSQGDVIWTSMGSLPTYYIGDGNVVPNLPGLAPYLQGVVCLLPANSGTPSSILQTKFTW
jgi:hypothetical protein